MPEKQVEPLPVLSGGYRWRSPLDLPHGVLSAIITVLVEAGAFVLHYKAGHLRVLELILLAIATASLTLLLENYFRLKRAQKRFEPVTSVANALLSLFEDLQNTPLEAHVKEDLDHRIKTLKNFLSGNQLEFTYSEQIEIANSLAKETKAKLWAVSADTPSVLWREGSNTYFQTLKGLPTQCDKKRLVLLKFQLLLNDYEASHRDFLDFVNWHAQNNFHLNFRFIDPDSSVEDYISKNLVETPEGRLTDFLIRDRDCVYGRIRAATGNRVVLRFITSPVSQDTVKNYEDLFNAAWNGSQNANHVKNLLTISSQKRKLLMEHDASTEERRTTLATAFAGKESGVKFFEEVCMRVKNAKTAVRAVDIAAFKDSLDQWGSGSEYHGFLSASIAAAKAGKNVRRLYVVAKLSDITSLPLVKGALRSQLDANIEVGILEEDTAITGCVNTDDYILVDGDFGFYLGEQQFSKSELEYGKNTLSKSHIETFSAIFDQLFESSLVRKLSMSDIETEPTI